MPRPFRETCQYEKPPANETREPVGFRATLESENDAATFSAQGFKKVVQMGKTRRKPSLIQNKEIEYPVQTHNCPNFPMLYQSSTVTTDKSIRQ